MKNIKEKKLMIVGDSGCGKTSILKVTDCSVNPDLPTVYFKFLTGLNLKKKKKKKILLSLWDTPGLPTDEWGTTREAIYPHLHAVIVVFALDDRLSLRNAVYKWYPQVRKHCSRKIPVILVGNKLDLRDNPESSTISYEEGFRAAEKIKAYAYVECSALNEEGTINVFSFAIQSIVKKSNCEIL